jgi:hypothetical protein
LGIVLFGPANAYAQQLRVEKIWEVGEIDGLPERVWERISDAVFLKKLCRCPSP